MLSGFFILFQIAGIVDFSCALSRAVAIASMHLCICVCDLREDDAGSDQVRDLLLERIENAASTTRTRDAPSRCAFASSTWYCTYCYC